MSNLIRVYKILVGEKGTSAEQNKSLTFGLASYLTRKLKLPGKNWEIIQKKMAADKDAKDTFERAKRRNRGLPGLEIFDLAFLLKVLLFPTEKEESWKSYYGKEFGKKEIRFAHNILEYRGEVAHVTQPDNWSDDHTMRRMLTIKAFAELIGDNSTYEVAENFLGELKRKGGAPQNEENQGDLNESTTDEEKEENNEFSGSGDIYFPMVSTEGIGHKVLIGIATEYTPEHKEASRNNYLKDIICASLGSMEGESKPLYQAILKSHDQLTVIIKNTSLNKYIGSLLPDIPDNEDRREAKYMDPAVSSHLAWLFAYLVVE